MIQSYDFNFLALFLASCALISEWSVAAKTKGSRFKFLFELDYQNIIWYSLFFISTIFFKFEDKYNIMNAAIHALLGMVFTTNIAFSYFDKATTFEVAQRYSNWFSHVCMALILFVNYYDHVYATKWWMIPILTGAMHLWWLVGAWIYKLTTKEDVYYRYNLGKLRGMFNFMAMYATHTGFAMAFWFWQDRYFETLPKYVTLIVAAVPLINYTVSLFFIKNTTMAEDNTMKSSDEYARLNPSSQGREMVSDDLL